MKVKQLAQERAKCDDESHKVYKNARKKLLEQIRAELKDRYWEYVMSCSDRQINIKVNREERNTFSAQVFQCIAYITHKCPLLQELFLKWTDLTIKEKLLLNYIAFHAVEKGQIELYAPIIQGFGYWNTLQDTEGACGFHENPLDFKFDLEEEKRIFQIIFIIDKIITNILLRSRLCREIKHFKIKGNANNPNKGLRPGANGWGDNL